MPSLQVELMWQLTLGKRKAAAAVLKELFYAQDALQEAQCEKDVAILKVRLAWSYFSLRFTSLF